MGYIYYTTLRNKEVHRAENGVSLVCDYAEKYCSEKNHSLYGKYTFTYKIVPNGNIRIMYKENKIPTSALGLCDAPIAEKKKKKATKNVSRGKLLKKYQYWIMAGDRPLFPPEVWGNWSENKMRTELRKWAKSNTYGDITNFSIGGVVFCKVTKRANFSFEIKKAISSCNTPTIEKKRKYEGWIMAGDKPLFPPEVWGNWSKNKMKKELCEWAKHNSYGNTTNFSIGGVVFCKVTKHANFYFEVIENN